MVLSARAQSILPSANLTQAPKRRAAAAMVCPRLNSCSNRRDGLGAAAEQIKVPSTFIHSPAAPLPAALPFEMAQPILPFGRRRKQRQSNSLCSHCVHGSCTAPGPPLLQGKEEALGTMDTSDLILFSRL